MFTRILRWILATVGVGIAMLLAVLVFAVYFSGPDLQVIRTTAGVQVRATFMGEYSLGLERLVLEDLTTRHVVLEAISRESSFADVIDFAPGAFNAAEALGPEAHILRPASGLILLFTGHDYRLTVWGNNGSARIRPSSCRFGL